MIDSHNGALQVKQYLVKAELNGDDDCCCKSLNPMGDARSGSGSLRAVWVVDTQ